MYIYILWTYLYIFSITFIFSSLSSFFLTGFKTDRHLWRARNQQQLQVWGDLSEIRSGTGLMVTLCTCTHPPCHCDGWPIGESIQCVVIYHFLKGANYARLPCVLIMAFSSAQSSCLSSALTLVFRAITVLLFTLPGREEELLNLAYVPAVTSETLIPHSGSLNT